MKFPDWWYKPATFGVSVSASIIGTIVGFIMWAGMVLYENHEHEIRDTFSTMKGKLVSLFRK